MADPSKDMLVSDSIETLQKAQKLSLQGGGVVFVAFLFLVYQCNAANPKWTVDGSVQLAMVIVAGVLGLASVVARIIDASLRTRMALKLMDQKGTFDPKDTKKDPFTAWKHLTDPDGSMVFSVANPESFGGVRNIKIAAVDADAEPA